MHKISEISGQRYELKLKVREICFRILQPLSPAIKKMI